MYCPDVCQFIIQKDSYRGGSDDQLLLRGRITRKIETDYKDESENYWCDLRLHLYCLTNDDSAFGRYFIRPDHPVYALAVTGNRICSIALLFYCFNIFASGMFTALNNGIVSAVLAFSRSFVFMMVCLLVLPVLLGVRGIWLANPLAELLAIMTAGIFLQNTEKNIGY